MRKRPVSMALLFGFCLAASMGAKERTLIFDDEWEVYTLTFDDSKISEQMLRQLAWLSPRMTEVVPAPYESATEQRGNWIDKVFFAPPLEWCIAGDARYKDCARNRPGTRTFFHNAEVNVARGEEQVQRLSSLEAPSELNPVKQYLLSTLQLYLSAEKARLAYYKSWDVKILAHETEKICGEDPKPELLKSLSAERNRTARYRLALYDWYNEVNDCIHRRSKDRGSYPMENWEAFLKAYGIIEHYRVRWVD